MPQNATHNCRKSGCFGVSRFDTSQTRLHAAGGNHIDGFDLAYEQLADQQFRNRLGTLAFTAVPGEAVQRCRLLVSSLLTVPRAEILHRLNMIGVK
jgi:hypothetical protein